MLYYQHLIEEKLLRGEEVPEDDELCTLLREACEAYEKWIEPYLSVE